MNRRPILVLLLFAGSVGMIGWLYYAVTRPALKGFTTQETKVIAGLDDCCRRKHIKSAQYDHFATIAEGENQQSAAQLFRAMALSERIQEAQCALVITKLGGRYQPPRRILLFRGTTAGNIGQSIRYEAHSSDSLHRAHILHSLHAGHRLAARLLIWASATDLRHRQLLEQLDHLPPKSGYAVCPTCGNIYSTAYCDSYCPQCLTDGRRFIQYH